MATVFMANTQGVEANQFSHRLYEIVAPSVRAAVKEPGQAKPPDPALRRYAGTYSVGPWGGEIAVFTWEDGLGLLTKLKKTAEHRFRRLRKDDRLGEEIVFEMGPDGRPRHFKRHSNYYARVR